MNFSSETFVPNEICALFLGSLKLRHGDKIFRLWSLGKGKLEAQDAKIPLEQSKLEGLGEGKGVQFPWCLL